jgi:hypothetical protein
MLIPVGDSVANGYHSVSRHFDELYVSRHYVELSLLVLLVSRHKNISPKGAELREFYWFLVPFTSKKVLGIGLFF